jgi:hypothetical protein
VHILAKFYKISQYGNFTVEGEFGVDETSGGGSLNLKGDITIPHHGPDLWARRTFTWVKMCGNTQRAVIGPRVSIVLAIVVQ